MASYVNVANLALQKMGADDTLTAPDEDSPAARTIAAAWDLVRQGVIRGGKQAPFWNFARRYVVSPARAPTAAQPLPQGWSTAVPEPTGALRLAEIVTPALTSRGDWQVAGGEVLLRCPGPLGAWWLFDVPEVALWDSLFVETFAARLAYQCADRITGDRGRKKDSWDEYEANLAAATKVDAREQPPTEPEEDDWVLARFGGCGGGSRGWTR